MKINIYNRAILLIFLIVHSISVCRSDGWTYAPNPGAYLDNCGLLSDARVMCHVLGKNTWKVLKPDQKGAYENGVWSDVAAMSSSYMPMHFSVQTLINGSFLSIGGEYNCIPNGLSCSFMTTAEIHEYNPSADVWSKIEGPPGWSVIRDFPVVNRANGDIVVAQPWSGANANPSYSFAMFSVGTMQWSYIADSLCGSAEAGLTLLPSGNFLNLCLFWPSGQSASWPGADLYSIAQIYKWSENSWSYSSAVNVSLADDLSPWSSFETGPSILLPTGDVYFIGSNVNATSPDGSGSAHTVLYRELTDQWFTAPDIPNNDGANDAPAAVLPGGDVLFQAAPSALSNPIEPSVFGKPSRFYIYDGDTIAQIAPPNALCAPICNFPSYMGRMLVLPTGQILLTEGDNLVAFYSSNKSPVDKWRPVVSSVNPSIQLGGTYVISGTQFNGLTTGNAYGDENEANTNFPIVRLVNKASGNVFYPMTHDHSTMGVATGDMQTSTSFDVPSNIETGPSQIFVVANGISSVGHDILVVDPNSTYALTVTKAGNGSGTVSSNPSGINCGSTCSYSFNSGTSVVLSAAASSGSTFTGWSGGVCGGLGFITDKTCVVQVSSAKNVTAIFDPNYSYIYVTNYGTRYGTVVSPALSINCGFSCSARVLIGSQITLIAQANRLQGTSFKGWIGDCAAYGASSICYLDVAGKDLSVGAIFK